MIKRTRYFFSGTVQGVGFRPFIYRIATANLLSGYVQNNPDGVVVEVEGPSPAIDQFLSDVRTTLPPLADIAGLTQTELDPQSDAGFRIVASETEGRGDLHITPDTATCPNCLSELFNPEDRRYHYPFINCTNCGPRLTIITDIPYDRANTSMSCFPMCPQCLKEYEDPANRRFHAEPNACPVCGPQLMFLNADGKQMPDGDPLAQAIEALKSGSIIAVKGLGGFHLAVDATNDMAVNRLRLRKFREEKPLAVMVKDMDQAGLLAEIDDEDKALLLSVERSIVLVEKKNETLISEAVAPGMANLGMMLPYTPLHHLLLEEHFRALVMTSANQTDEPICIGNREAIARLQGIADYYLVHNRDILVRCDDSIAMTATGSSVIMRRSRGFAPKPIKLAEAYPEVLALGPQMKNTLCVLKGKFAFLSPHIGDLETPQARDFFLENLRLMKRITECSPRIIACDLHPGYYSTQVGRTLEADQVIGVQHHHAHIVSCMAENGITGKVIGLAMDGTGYGTDGQVWGGEFLVADEAEFSRMGHIKYYMLPGGEKAIHEPWRTASSLLKEAYGDSWIPYAERLNILPEKKQAAFMDMIMAKRINSPYTSSMGRLFDGVASILGLRQKVSFEGQAAMELEATANETPTIGAVYPFTIEDDGDIFYLHMTPVIRTIVQERLAGGNPEELAFSFHRTIIVSFSSMAEKIRAKTGLNRVVLSGGCFQNRILLEGCHNILKESGFEVFSHRLVPHNDGCISLGQAVCAGARVKNIISKKEDRKYEI